MTSSPTRKDSQASGSYAGFALQATRLLHRLLEASAGDVISLEVFDDVGVERADGTKAAEQDKNTVKGNPVSNRSAEFWKTISNWILAVERGHIPLNVASFELYVSRDASGSIVEKFSKASTSAEAKEAYLFARQTLWGTNPQLSHKAVLVEGIKDYVNHVFESNETTVVEIIRRIKLLNGSGSPIKDVEAQFKKQFIKDYNVEKLVNFAHGWIKTKIDTLHEQGFPAFISQDDFHRELTSLTGKIDRQEILARFAPDPTEEEIERDLKSRIYVRQLEIIGCDFDDRIAAVVHFLRASADRTKWSEMGIVHESSFDEFEEDLKAAWKNHRRASNVEVGDRDHQSRGQHLYARCSLHTAKLESSESPSYFTCGSFHALSDAKEIGWHPNYPEELTK